MFSMVSLLMFVFSLFKSLFLLFSIGCVLGEMTRAGEHVASYAGKMVCACEHTVLCVGGMEGACEQCLMCWGGWRVLVSTVPHVLGEWSVLVSTMPLQCWMSWNLGYLPIVVSYSV